MTLSPHTSVESRFIDALPTSEPPPYPRPPSHHHALSGHLLYHARRSITEYSRVAPDSATPLVHVALARGPLADSPVPTTSIVGDLCGIMSVRRVRGWTVPRLGAGNVSTHHRGVVETMLLAAQPLPKVRLTCDNIVL